jgi:hypothetical protein
MTQLMFGSPLFLADTMVIGRQLQSIIANTQLKTYIKKSKII